MIATSELDWFKYEVIDFGDLAEARCWLDDFDAGTSDGIIVRHAYDDDYMKEIGARIGRHDPPFDVFPPVTPWSVTRTQRHLYGTTLVAAGADLTGYFRVATNFRSHCQALFQDGVAFEDRIREIFDVLSGGRPFQLAETFTGDIYMPATVRILPNGAGIDLHCDNNLAHHPSYQHLSTLCRLQDQMSYFLTVNSPGEGGELIVYRHLWSSADDAPGEFVMAKSDGLVEQCEQIAIKTEPGDVIVFGGGRIYHRVAESIGPEPRYTIGGFVAPALDRDELYYWS